MRRAGVTALVAGAVVAAMIGAAPPVGLDRATDVDLAASTAVLGRAATAAAAGPGTPQPTGSASARVGALFSGGGLNGSHFCTASVVQSASGDVIVSAAHCLNAATNGSGVVFVPGYRDGTAPYGVWQLTSVTEAAGWTKSHDPSLDVAFATVAPVGGRTLEQTVGADALGIDPGTDRSVTLTGYPDSADEPLVCQNAPTRFSASQLRIACPAYTDGTSGGPWVIQNGSGSGGGEASTVIGVIGGYQQGGDTADVSYSSYFGSAVAALYRRAGGTPVTVGP